MMLEISFYFYRAWYFKNV